MTDFDLKEELKRIEAKLILNLPLTNKEKSLFTLYAPESKLKLLSEVKNESI